jgi:hypothetical protein
MRYDRAVGILMLGNGRSACVPQPLGVIYIAKQILNPRLFMPQHGQLAERLKTKVVNIGLEVVEP